MGLRLCLARAACVVNAARCGRLHCYVTGPLYLLLATGGLLRGLHVLTLSWRRIFGAAMVGTVLAYCPEWIWRKYVKAGSKEQSASPCT